MSVLQDIRVLTKELYFSILSRRKSSFHARFQVHGLPVCKLREYRDCIKAEETRFGSQGIS